MKDMLEGIVGITIVLLLFFLFDGDPNVWELLLKIAKERLQ